MQSDEQGQHVPSMPTQQLLNQGQQEGSQGPLPPGCPPPAVPPASLPLHSSCGFRLEYPGSALEGGNPAHPGRWSFGTAQPLWPWGGRGFLLSPNSGTSPSGFQLYHYPPKFVSFPSHPWEVYLAMSPLEPHSPGDREGQMQLEWQVPALTQGRVSISLCGHVSLHPLRGADCPAAPESLSSFPSTHREYPRGVLPPTRGAGQMFSVATAHTAWGAKTGPCGQTDRKID